MISGIFNSPEKRNAGLVLFFYNFGLSEKENFKRKNHIKTIYNGIN